MLGRHAGLLVEAKMPSGHCREAAQTVWAAPVASSLEVLDHLARAALYMHWAWASTIVCIPFCKLVGKVEGSRGAPPAATD